MRKDLACYTEGMSKDVSRRVGFVNVAASTAVDVMDEAVGLT